ncbi:hypothetical protein QQ045_027299 [Rhodiola kirilowii]
MKVVWGSFGSSDAIFKDVDMPLPYEMVVLLRWGEHTIINGHTCTKLSILPNQQVTDENLSAYGYQVAKYDIEVAYFDLHRIVPGIFRHRNMPTRRNPSSWHISMDSVAFFRRIDSVGIVVDMQIWGGEVGTQYRSGIYYYNDEQERLAKESLDSKQNEMKGKKIVTEILPTKSFYRAEEYHQQYLAKGGRNG